MRILLTTLMFALGALIVPAVLAPAQAHAAYSINLDCSSTVGPGWADTTNIVTVKALKKNGSRKTLISRAITFDDCFTFHNVIQGWDANDVLANVVRFEIAINGSDTFWADAVWALEGPTHLSWGNQGDAIGFCVRTTVLNNNHCQGGSAASQWNLFTGN